MLHVEIVAIGTLKEKYLKDACAEYTKRLKPYCSLSVREIREERLPAGGSVAGEATVIAKESEALMAAAEGKDTFVIALDSGGKRLSSEGFAAIFEEAALSGKNRLVFLIGGSLGLSESAKSKTDMCVSFSDMTFPHQLMRVILFEQVYRAFKINRGEPYHK